MSAPPVVLDLDVYDRLNAPTALRRLADHLTSGDNVYGRVARDIADQIEAQTRPPKPDEPKGLGAVVKDRDGLLWCRAADASEPWLSYFQRGDGDYWLRYEAIDAVEVLSDGVSP